MRRPAAARTVLDAVLPGTIRQIATYASIVFANDPSTAAAAAARAAMPRQGRTTKPVVIVSISSPRASLH